ncbi:MAG: hypothetical protein ABI895_11655 [Deltaproteobacteria bacterium]
MNDDPYQRLRGRHLSFGWYALLGFASVGALLEALHAFKVGSYLDVGSETRRLMWRLGHAHGVLLGLVQLGFAATLPHTKESARPRLAWASACLIAAGLLLPLGFLLGGVFAAGGDPGPPVLLVPLAIPLLLAALWWTARSVH